MSEVFSWGGGLTQPYIANGRTLINTDFVYLIKSMSFFLGPVIEARRLKNICNGSISRGLTGFG